MVLLLGALLVVVGLLGRAILERGSGRGLHERVLQAAVAAFALPALLDRAGVLLHGRDARVRREVMSAREAGYVTDLGGDGGPVHLSHAKDALEELDLDEPLGQALQLGIELLLLGLEHDDALGDLLDLHLDDDGPRQGHGLPVQGLENGLR